MAPLKSFVAYHPQLTVFAVLALMTILLVGLHVISPHGLTGGMRQAHARPLMEPDNRGAAAAVSDVSLHAELSQTKLVQGQDGTVYVNLHIQTPEMRTCPFGKTATDIVVVLDRSPSMMAANKWPYAKAAVLELLSQLDASDRLGLVAFDRYAAVYSELVAVTPAARQRLTHVVQNMTVGSATNIGDGLLHAKTLMENSPSQRVKKMLLLSDGETNTGITDPNALARLASEISDQPIVLSTIGMGLGFNESLMATLADHGMGNYSYLEHLETLGHILAKDLDDTRRIYAESSELRLHLPDGVKLEDAAGYPVQTADGDMASVRIKTG